MEIDRKSAIFGREYVGIHGIRYVIISGS